MKETKSNTSDESQCAFKTVEAKTFLKNEKISFDCEALVTENCQENFNRFF